MRAYSMDLRKRVVDVYDREPGWGAQARIARRFGVSAAWVCALLRRREQGGDYGPVKGKQGRKAVFAGRALEQLEKIVEQQPDVTLAELKDRTGVSCSLTAICKTLQRLGYRRKRRRCGPLSRIAPTFSDSVGNGG